MKFGMNKKTGQYGPIDDAIDERYEKFIRVCATGTEAALNVFLSDRTFNPTTNNNAGLNRAIATTNNAAIKVLLSDKRVYKLIPNDQRTFSAVWRYSSLGLLNYTSILPGVLWLIEKTNLLDLMAKNNVPSLIAILHTLDISKYNPLKFLQQSVDFGQTSLFEAMSQIVVKNGIDFTENNNEILNKAIGMFGEESSIVTELLKYPRANLKYRVQKVIGFDKNVDKSDMALRVLLKTFLIKEN